DSVSAGIHTDRRDVAPADDPVAVDHEECSLARAVPVAIDTVEPRDLALRLEVGQERKPEMPVLREGEVTPDPVDGDTDELRVEPRELGGQLLVERELIRTDGAPVLRVEDEDDGTAAEVGEGHRLARSGPEFEVGSFSSSGEGLHLALNCFLDIRASMPIVAGESKPVASRASRTSRGYRCRWTTAHERSVSTPSPPSDASSLSITSA